MTDTKFLGNTLFIDKRQKFPGEMCVLESREADLFRSMAIIGLILGLSCISANAQIDRISVADGGVEANGGSDYPAVSDDGRIIAFQSNADNLVAGDTNTWTDVFVHDVATGTTELISLQPNGNETPGFSMRPSISDDGRFVAFEGKSAVSFVSLAAVADRQAGTVEHFLPRTLGGGAAAPRFAQSEPGISGSGQFIALRALDEFFDLWPASIRPPNDDNNSAIDVYVYDRATQPTPPLERSSRDSLGVELDADSRWPSLSDDGRFVVFMSYSDGLVSDSNEQPDVFLKDRQTGLLELISTADGIGTGNGASFNPEVSADANVIAFRSDASDLVPGDSNERWDIFVRRRDTATTERISVASDGTQANHHSMEASISDDGRFVVFRSMASNLVPGDGNQRDDIFLHDRSTGQTVRVGQPATGESNGHSFNPVISGDGAWVLFVSYADNLVPDDSNGESDIFRTPNPLYSVRVGEGR